MAACSFGASSLKLFNLNLVPSETKPATLQSPRIQTLIRYDGLSLSLRADKPFFRCRCLPVAQSHLSLENDDEEAKPSGTTSPFIPNSFEVESLLTKICDTTSIAEFELKLGGFRLYVTRDLAGKYETSTLPVSAPALSTPVAIPEEPVLDGATSSTSLAISRPVSVGLQSFFDKSADEGLVTLQSPRVGYFKRSRTIKGKRAPPSCKEKQEIKEGQVLCFVEQLGGEIPIESDTSGKVIKILREDGDPVGYGDALIAILPSFPGIKKLQ